MNSPLIHSCSKLSFSGLVFFFFFFGLTLKYVGSQCPDQGLNPCPLQWKHRAPITGSPEKPHPFSSVFFFFFLMYTLGILTLHLLNKLQMSFSALFILYDAVFWSTLTLWVFWFFFFTHSEFYLCNAKSFPLLLMNFESWLKTSPHLGSRRIHLCFLLNNCMVRLLKLSSKEATQLKSGQKI